MRRRTPVMSKLKRCLCSLGSSLLLIGSCLTGITVSADETGGYTENSINYTAAEGGVKVSGAENSVEKLTIPAKTDRGDKVVAIGDNAFSPCTALKTVTIESGLTEIGQGAFSQCTALESISIPDSVTKIGQGAFYYCMALESLELPDSVESLGEYLCSNCYALKTVKLPKGLRTLPSYAFYFNIGLQEMTLPDGMESVSAMSFVNCLSMKTLSIPASLTDLGDYSMLSCSGLTGFTVDPNNRVYRTNGEGWLVTKDGSMLVMYPAGRDEKTAAVPNGITTVKPYAFSGALALEEVRLPDSLTTLGDGAFADCRKLNSIVLPFRLTELPPSLFANCENLTEIALPANIAKIGNYAFYCTGLTDITIPESVTEIGSCAFCGCNALREATVPKTVTKIGEMAFGYTTNSEEEGAAPTLDSSFVLHGTPNSAAKEYAAAAGVTFKQHGMDLTVLLCILVGAAALIIILCGIFWKKKHPQPETANESEPEEIDDPNYSSILEDDDEDGDLYDRSIGFSAEDEDADGGEPEEE